VPGLKNLVLDNSVAITASGVLNNDFEVESVADRNMSSSWVSQPEGEKWLEFSWPTEKEIGHIQFVNGWQSSDRWNGLLSEYKIEALVYGNWVELGAYDVKANHDHSEDFHVYGVDWSPNHIKYYFDNKLIRTMPNTRCNTELHIWLSLAIFEFAGEVTDAIDGTSMKVDWVRYYKQN